MSGNRMLVAVMVILAIVLAACSSSTTLNEKTPTPPPIGENMIPVSLWLEKSDFQKLKGQGVAMPQCVDNFAGSPGPGEGFNLCLLSGEIPASLAAALPPGYLHSEELKLIGENAVFLKSYLWQLFNRWTAEGVAFWVPSWVPFEDVNSCQRLSTGYRIRRPQEITSLPYVKIIVDGVVTCETTNLYYDLPALMVYFASIHGQMAPYYVLHFQDFPQEMLYGLILTAARQKWDQDQAKNVNRLVEAGAIVVVGIVEIAGASYWLAITPLPDPGDAVAITVLADGGTKLSFALVPVP